MVQALAINRKRHKPTGRHVSLRRNAFRASAWMAFVARMRARARVKRAARPKKAAERMARAETSNTTPTRTTSAPVVLVRERVRANNTMGFRARVRRIVCRTIASTGFVAATFARTSVTHARQRKKGAVPMGNADPLRQTPTPTMIVHSRVMARADASKLPMVRPVPWRLIAYPATASMDSVATRRARGRAKRVAQ